MAGSQVEKFSLKGSLRRVSSGWQRNIPTTVLLPLRGWATTTIRGPLPMSSFSGTRRLSRRHIRGVPKRGGCRKRAQSRRKGPAHPSTAMSSVVLVEEFVFCVPRAKSKTSPTSSARPGSLRAFGATEFLFLLGLVRTASGVHRRQSDGSRVKTSPSLEENGAPERAPRTPAHNNGLFGGYGQTERHVRARQHTDPAELPGSL